MNTKNFSDAMGELSTRYVNESINYNKNMKVHKIHWAKWGAIAACLGFVLVSAFSIKHFTENGTVPQIEQLAPAAYAPNGIRKLMNYNGSRYVFMGNGATYKLSDKQLKNVLGTLDYDIQADPQANAKKQFSATFALGGTVYEMKDYDPAFRIAVESEGNYYICQRVGLTDNAAMDISEYFEAARFPEIIDEVSIYDHAGTQMLSGVPEKEITALIDVLAQAEPAKLSNEDFQEISRAQKEGNSYQLFFELNDGTTYQLYVIPSLGITMLGDNRYALPENFADDFGYLFDGLSQKMIPAQ